MIMKNLFIFVIFIAISNVRSPAAQSPPDDQRSTVDVLRVLVKKCFVVQNDDAYDPNDIVASLNRQTGVALFDPSNDGLKINSDVFSRLLIDCLKSNVAVLSSDKNVQEDISTIVSRNERVLSTVLNASLRDRSIPLRDVERLAKERDGNRSKRAVEFPLNIVQELLLNLVVEPIQSSLNNVLSNVGAALRALLVPSTDVSDPIQGIIIRSTNSALNAAINVISNVQNRLNAFLDTFNGTSTATASNVMERSKNRALVFPFDVISNLLETTIVAPIRNTVNRILVALNTTVNSFYSTAGDDNPVQGVLNNVVNEAVTNIVKVINSIYEQVNGVLNGISGIDGGATV